MATIRSRSGQTVTVPDSTLQSYLDQGWINVNAPDKLAPASRRKSHKTPAPRKPRTAAKSPTRPEPDAT